MRIIQVGTKRLVERMRCVSCGAAKPLKSPCALGNRCPGKFRRVCDQSLVSGSAGL